MTPSAGLPSHCAERTDGVVRLEVTPVISGEFHLMRSAAFVCFSHSKTVFPAAAATRESVAPTAGRGHVDIDFAVLLPETARDVGLELHSEGVNMSDGLEA